MECACCNSNGSGISMVIVIVLEAPLASCLLSLDSLGKFVATLVEDARRNFPPKCNISIPQTDNPGAVV